MLTDFLHVLADPATGHTLTAVDGGSAVEGSDHRRYPVAPAGYVVFADDTTTGDDAQMVQARETFLSQGLFGPFVEAVTNAVHDALDEATDPDAPDEISHPVILDVGAGTGYYLSHTLDDVQGAIGVGIDISEPAALRLAGCHRNVISVLADANSRLPLRDDSVDVATVVFAPHNAAECARVLRPKGQVVALMAAPGHLSELRAPLGITDVDADAIASVHRDLASHFRPVDEAEVIQFPMNLDHEAIAGQIGMSPSAQHIDPMVLAERVATLPKHMTVTAKAVVQRFELLD